MLKAEFDTQILVLALIQPRLLSRAGIWVPLLHFFDPRAVVPEDILVVDLGKEPRLSKDFLQPFFALLEIIPVNRS